MSNMTKTALKGASNKRLRQDGAHAKTQAMAKAVELVSPIDLPPHLSLRPQDIPFWNDILRARAREEWGRIELVVAQQLARCQATIKAYQDLCDSGDRKAMEALGFPSVRALNDNIGALIKQQTHMMVVLKIAGTVAGDPQDLMPLRKAEREAEATVKRMRAEDGDEQLLAL